MKTVIATLFLLWLLSFQSNAQYDLGERASDSRASLTIGILQGGGSLVGADLEFLASDRLGIQLGAGLVGFGGGINYHLKPTIRSSYFSFQYWHQGTGESFTQSVAGPNFVYRGKRWFTFQIGAGIRIEEGPALPNSLKDTPFMLMYAIGAYIPL
jgi:hypothetical protein